MITPTITQEDISILLGREPRRGEGSFVAWLQDWLLRREQQEPDGEWERRTR